MSQTNTLPDETGTVVIGAGIAGCNTAYHLAELGREDVLVVDQGPLPTTGGSSSHAPGIMFQTDEPKVLSKFATYSRQLYSDLEDEEGKAPYNEMGGIEVARSEERVDYLKRRVEWAKSWGIPDPQLLSPEEVTEKLPLVDPEAIEGGYYSPTDGQCSGARACAALLEEAEAMGVQFVGHSPVESIETDEAGIKAIVTEDDRVECGEVVVATNIWARQLGEELGVHLPVAPVEHQYTITEPIEELSGLDQDVTSDPIYENYKAVSGDKTDVLLQDPDRPILRDQDNAMYFRTHGDRYGLGSYNHEPIVPDPAELGGTEA